MKKKTLSTKLISIEDARPPNNSWCLCIVKDVNTKEKFVKTGYYSGETLWDNEREDASSTVRVLWWILVKDVKVETK